MRDRLIELLDELGVIVDLPDKVDEDGCGTYTIEGGEYVADYLLANGVIVPPCKVGDTVYVIFSQFKNEISKCKVDEILVQDDGIHTVLNIYYPNFIAKRNTTIPAWWFGRFAFFTEEEATAALKGALSDV